MTHRSFPSLPQRIATPLRPERRLPLPLTFIVALLPPLLFLGFVLFQPAPVRGAVDPTFTVNSTLDEPEPAGGIADGICQATPSGKCTLRAAIQQAELMGAATIILPSGTYVLTLGQLDIKAGITIEGAGAPTTIIDGNGDNPDCYPATALSCRIFDMKTGSSLTASGLTVRNGKAGEGESTHYHGGAIHNHGTLTLTNVVISESAVVATGWGGGGLTTAGGATAFLEGVTVNGNIAKANGGGIENLGGLSLINSTVSGNTAEGLGGGVWHSGATTSALNSVTIAGNSAAANGGGGINRTGGVALNVQKTILASNTGGNCAGMPVSFAPGYNVSSDGSCPFANPGDRNSTDPQLGPLQDNGGGLPTHKPAPTSPAVDLIPLPCGSADQRGVSRPQGAGCDSGAVELRLFTLTLDNGGGNATGGGPYREGAVASLGVAPTAAQVFTGWTIDGQPEGWANPLTITMNADHNAAAAFAARQTFADAGPGQTGATEAIAQLAARGIIKGCDPGANLFCPTDPTLRAQMAVLIVRALGWGDENPINPFPDRNGVDDELWRAVAILADHGVAKGYSDGTYGTTSPVLNAQVISFITRAMEDAGYWQFQTDDNTVYPNVAPGSGHRVDLATYVHYAGPVRGTASSTVDFAGWDQPSSRAYFAFALWQALDSYFSVDRVP
ncbi:MAG TPA: choice-of-anchor Q domain-containing protein [Thermomicrobiales bacterium]